jgi:hypothetical protein
MAKAYKHRRRQRTQRHLKNQSYRPSLRLWATVQVDTFTGHRAKVQVAEDVRY